MFIRRNFLSVIVLLLLWRTVFATEIWSVEKFKEKLDNRAVQEVTIGSDALFGIFINSGGEEEPFIVPGNFESLPADIQARFKQNNVKVKIKPRLNEDTILSTSFLIGIFCLFGMSLAILIGVIISNKKLTKLIKRQNH